MRLFFSITTEDVVFGLYPKVGFYFRWRDAEDGRTWIAPTFGRINYGGRS